LSSDDEIETDTDSDINVIDANTDESNDSSKIKKDETPSNKKRNSFDNDSTSKTILFDKKDDINQSKTDVKMKDDEDLSDKLNITRMY